MIRLHSQERSRSLPKSAHSGLDQSAEDRYNGHMGERPTSPSWTERELDQLVNRAFRSYRDVLELANSALAIPALIAPALILDSESPSDDDRGRALRTVLRWATSRLAPEEPRYPGGTPRPPDDPTWMNPLWWPHNILRHRYIEPLHPDDYIEGGRAIDTLLALTGIPSQKKLFGERRRGIREVAKLLRAQMANHQFDDEIRRQALESLYQSLGSQPTARTLLEIAATFRGDFPRALLLDMAVDESLPNAGPSLGYLLHRRLLQESGESKTMLMPAPLQSHLHELQAERDRIRRHERAAHFYQDKGQPLTLAWHLQQGKSSAEAADILLQMSRDLLGEQRVAELLGVLQGFAAQELSPAQWWGVQFLSSELLQRMGDYDGALQACHRALQVAQHPDQKARTYCRMGRLYQDYQPARSLMYYQEAEKWLDGSASELSSLLRERASVHMVRREWVEAESALAKALALLEGRFPNPDPKVSADSGTRAPAAAARTETGPDRRWLHAEIYYALGLLYFRQERYKPALPYAQQSVVLREEMGDLAGLLESYNILGILHARLDDRDTAITFFSEGLRLAQQEGHLERVADMQMNIGVVLSEMARWEEAIPLYQQSLATYRDFGVPQKEAVLLENLVDSLAALGRVEEARRYWLDGYRLCQREELVSSRQSFEELEKKIPALQGQEAPSPAQEEDTGGRPAGEENHGLAGHTAQRIAQSQGKVTVALLMRQAHISKATATRILSQMTAQGLVQRCGRGRGTYYIRTQSNIENIPRIAD